MLVMESRKSPRHLDGWALTAYVLFSLVLLAPIPLLWFNGTHDWMGLGALALYGFVAVRVWLHLVIRRDWH